MNVLICDDRQEDAKQLDALLRDSGFSVETQVFGNGHDALDFVHTGAAVDVCILDIVMPEMSGVVLADRLREDGFTGEIVFLSTSNEYASEAFNVEAFGYLIKPPTPESVSKILSKLLHHHNRTDMASVHVKVAGIMKKILHRDISHVEVIKHKVFFRLTDGSEVETYATFTELAPKLLSDARFIRCHRSYIVNMDDVAAMSERETVLRGGRKIPITRTYREIADEYYKWEFGERTEDAQ